MLIRDKLAEAITKELYDKKVDYFIGGSTRFGYATADSDVDIIVLDSESNRQILLQMGLVGTRKVDDDDYFGTPIKTQYKTHKIQVSMIDKDEFQHQKDINDALFLVIRTRPDIYNTIKALKLAKAISITGTELFNLLRKNILGEECLEEYKILQKRK